MLYSSLLPALEGEAQTAIWTTSERNLDFGDANGSAQIAIEPFPAIRPFKEFPFNYLRRLNEFAWDYKLRPPSRTGIIQRFRDRETRLPIRALKFPARVLSLLRMENRLESWLEGVLLGYSRSPEGARRLQATIPDVMITTGSFRYEEPAVAAAALKLGIPTLTFITSWDNPSTKNRLVFKYDGYLAWSEQMRQDLYQFFPYTRQAPVYIVGAPQFDVFYQSRFHHSREAFCRRQRVDPERPIILYALGSPNLFREHDTVCYLADRVARGELGEVQLLIRPHPLHDKGLDLASLNRWGARVVVQDPGQAGLSVPARAQNEEQICDWVNTFRHAAVIVNLSSTAAIDAAICDKPVVNLDYDPEPGQPRQLLVKEINHAWAHFKPIAESGGMWLVNNPAEMVEAVKTYLERPELHREQRRAMAEHVCGFLDGRCGERMAEAILEFTRQQVQARGGSR
ncbi:MAG TPA: CDP-glycerol glycerophosphotransferase family protein [Blastocatellia bacterium]|nr:CDP-glycerol glycerophosphotransferase family protein [Blastocatellia bacterium]